MVEFQALEKPKKKKKKKPVHFEQNFLLCFPELLLFSR